jgi:VIT1/CCC1 family predicted Fe2+/Mn2+ transporter
MRSHHVEAHRSHRIGWLRAAVLGANDGVVSVASLVVGVAAGGAGQGAILLSGVAGLVAGAMSMAAGEYVSVQSQADTENADLARERRELVEEPDRELAELTAIYMQRGLDEPLARRVATTLMAHDALGAHSRDELGIGETLRARSLQASMASAAAFAAGAAVPILATLLAPVALLSPVIVAATLLTLAALGATAARAGGASIWRGSARVTFWGAAAMALTAGAGHLFGAAV